MQKKFFSSLLLIVLLNLLIKPFYIFGIDAQIQNTVPTEDYGIYFTLLNISFLFNIILDLGINNYNTKNIAQHPNILSRYLGSIVGLRFVLGFIYLIVTLGFGILAGYSSFAMHLLLLLGINQFFAGFIFYFRSNFAGMHWFKTDALLSILDRVILIILCLLLLYSGILGGEMKIEYFVYAQTLAYGFAALIAFLLTLRSHKSKIKVNKLFSLALVRQSAPYALLILLMMLYSRTDAIMLERLLEDGKTQVGIYAQGFRLLDAVNIFALLFAGILLPMFARLIKQKESLNALLTDSSKLLLSVAISVSLICSIYSEAIMDLVYNKQIITSSQSFKWIILSFIPIAIIYIFGTLLTANGSLKQLNKLAAFGFILNIVLNYFLIQNYKAEGAAIATLITQTIIAIAQIYICFNLFKLKVSLTLIVQLIALAVIIISFSFALRYFFNIDGIVAFVLCSFAAKISVFLLKLVSLRKIKEIV